MLPSFRQIFAWFGLTLLALHQVRARLKSCDLRRVRGKLQTGCSSYGSGITGYSMPGNFDVSLIDKKTERFAIDTFFAPHVAYENCTALPSLENLTEVVLWSFNQDANAPRFPLAHFFQHNRHRIQELRLRAVKLLQLTESDFRSFSTLLILGVNQASLKDVALTTFDSLGKLPSDEKMPAKLESLFMNDNPDLRSLDWSLLIPIAHSVKQIEVKNDGLTPTTLTCSTRFSLAKAEYINFSDNGLGPLPSTVSRTFNGALPRLKILQNSAGICVRGDHDDCQCCELQEMVSWLRSNFTVAGAIERKISCRYHDPAFERPVSLNELSYQHCS